MSESSCPLLWAHAQTISRGDVMRKTYRVYFIDARDGYPNQKLLEVDCVDDIYGYMAHLGHTVTKVEEVVS